MCRMKYHAMKAYWEWGCSFTVSEDQGEMEVSGQHHAAATLLLMKELQVCCEGI